MSGRCVGSGSCRQGALAVSVPMHRPFSWRSFVVLDEVTRFFQRRHFDEQLGARLLQAEREKRRLAVILVDADGVARINERWGMATGDAVMVGFDRRIASSLSP